MADVISKMSKFQNEKYWRIILGILNKNDIFQFFTKMHIFRAKNNRSFGLFETPDPEYI